MLISQGEDPDKFIKKEEKKDPAQILEMLNASGVPPEAGCEHEFYKRLRILVPPDGVNEPLTLEKNVFAPIRADRVDNIDWDVLDQVTVLIKDRWVVNYTMLDPDW
jgi:hypothetical protein